MIVPSSAYHHAERLTNGFGPRTVGTPGNRAAASYIAETFHAAGLEVEEIPYPCPDWEAGPARLELDGTLLEAYPNTYSPACAAAGRLLPLGTRAELEAADLSGAIPVLYGELAQAPWWTMAFFLTSEEDLARLRLLEEKRPAALITVNPTLGQRYRMIDDPDLSIPSATVSPETGRRLVKRAGQIARLSFSVNCQPGSSSHVLGRLSGQHAGRIIVCAHYDSRDDSPGAWDNAAGSGVILALAEAFARRPLRSTLELIAFTAEDEVYSTPDADPYFERYGGTLDGITALINLDAVGHVLGANSLSIYSASQQMEALVWETRAAFPGTLKGEQWPASNHGLFYMRGVPCLAMTAVGPNTYSFAHTPQDTVDWLSPAKLDEAAGLTAALVQALDPHDPAWTRPV